MSSHAFPASPDEGNPSTDVGILPDIDKKKVNLTFEMALDYMSFNTLEYALDLDEAEPLADIQRTV